MTPLQSLVGARVRRVDAPEPTLLALTLFTPDLRGVLLLRLCGERYGVGLVPQRPHGQPATSFVQKLRKELENSRITAFEQPSHASLALVLARGDLSARLVCDFAEPSARLERDGKILIRSTLRKGPSLGRGRLQVGWPTSVEELLERGKSLVAEGVAASLDVRRASLGRLLRHARKRLERRLGAIEQDRARAQQAEPLRARATLLLTQQHAVRRGQTRVRLLDYTLDPPAEVEIELDPARTLKEHVEAWFKQAKRYERGAQLASQRAEATRREIEQLDRLLDQTASADENALLELGQQARALGIAGVGQALAAEVGSAPTKKQPQGERKPFKRFASWKERVILVGKNATDNDELTREYARPQDLWLHARGYAGAHIVVPLERNEMCPDELLLDAAHLAAHFSDARGEPTVEISYTHKRHLRKPRGSAAGQVQLEREKVLALHVEPDRLARLLGQERND